VTWLGSLNDRSKKGRRPQAEQIEVASWLDVLKNGNRPIFTADYSVCNRGMLRWWQR
jgi:hypothetical protein